MLRQWFVNIANDFTSGADNFFFVAILLAVNDAH
jgi:hypothetical protein